MKSPKVSAIIGLGLLSLISACTSKELSSLSPQPLFGPGAVSGSYGVPTPCALAVCDMAAELSHYQSLKREDRLADLTRLRALVGESVESGVWDNFRQFLQQAQQWLLTQKPEVMEIDAVSGLVEEATAGLAKYSNPEGGALVRYYGEVRSADRRSEVVRYWMSQVEALESADAVAEVLDLFIKAEEFSGQSSDPSGMGQLARDAQSLASGRYLELNPVSEGVYELEVRGPKTKGNAFLNRVVVLQPFMGTGLEVYFTNKVSETDVYSFQHVKLRSRGLVIEGEGVTRGLPARFSMRLNLNNESIEGWFETSDSNERTQFVGRRVKSLLPIYEAARQAPNEAPLGQADLVRTFEGESITPSGRAKTRLLVRMMDNRLAATLTIQFPKRQGGFSLDESHNFDVVRVVESLGIVSLSTSDSKGGRLKIVAFVKKWPGEETWYLDGVTFSSSGGVNALRMTEVASE